MVKKIITRHDYNDAFQTLFDTAFDTYPDNPIKQLEYIKEKGTPQYYVLALLKVAQTQFAASPAEGKITMDVGELDVLYRAFLDAARHMQDDLPAGVYEYIQHRLEDATINALLKLNHVKLDV